MSRVLRAQIAQAEFSRKYSRGTWQPYIHEHFDNLVATLQGLGSKDAELLVLGAERFVGCISYEQYVSRTQAVEAEPEHMT